MQVYVQRSFGGVDAFDVWFVNHDRLSGKRQVAYFVPQEIGPARLEWRDTDPEVSTDPTLRLGGFEVHCLKLGLDEHGPTTTDATALAADAIKTRDRLLGLVEKLTARPGKEKAA